ncbi:tryptophan--tRNA ligase [Candidatus Saccharibacteria bacterium]|nr:tryptophan--tRNA ligase [Candidatus Saccharibacteria bacterium]
MKTVFSGLKPSGDMTIGNYLGAMKHWPDQQGSARTIFFVPNAHAITVRQDPVQLKKRTYDLVAWLLTVGLDPEKSIILVQSRVSAHAEMCWILDNYVTMGELSRMTEYKDKSQKLGPEGQLVGLFNYPVLMAADILLYSSNEVPVGEDQRQHIELARTIAERFNKLYGETFVLPVATMPASGARIKRLDDPSKKMSKSDHPDSFIMLQEPLDSIKAKFKKAVTDSDNTIKYDKTLKPAVSNLLEIYSGFSEESIDVIVDRYTNKGYGELKTDLGELVVEKLSTLQLAFNKIRADEQNLERVISEGSEKAAEIANKKLSEVKEKLGLL